MKDTQKILEELRQRAEDAIMQTKYEDIKKAETRKEAEVKTIAYCEKLMSYAEQDKTSYLFRSERNLLILFMLYVTVARKEGPKEKSEVVSLLAEFSNTMQNIISHMTKYPDDAPLLKPYFFSLNMCENPGEVAAALMTEINVMRRLMEDEG